MGRSVRQAGSTKLSDVKEFLQNETMPVVVKPTESAGSEGVKLCNSTEEAEEHFTLLMNSQRKGGSQNAAVLCQEFLKGKEYVVDHVSRDGVHKTTMAWRSNDDTAWTVPCGDAFANIPDLPPAPYKA